VSGLRPAVFLDRDGVLNERAGSHAYVRTVDELRLLPGIGEAAAALARVGLEERAWEQRLKVFSKGMRQKTGIAIAILKGAPNIILDEPTSGLDPKAAAEFMDLLAQLRAEGKAILMSTHDIFRAKEAADRVGIMQAGRLLVTRTRAELAADDLEELYLRYMDAAGGELEAA